MTGERWPSPIMEFTIRKDLEAFEHEPVVYPASWGWLVASWMHGSKDGNYEENVSSKVDTLSPRIRLMLTNILSEPAIPPLQMRSLRVLGLRPCATQRYQCTACCQPRSFGAGL